MQAFESDNNQIFPCLKCQIFFSIVTVESCFLGVSAFSLKFAPVLKMTASKVKLSTDHVLRGLDHLRNEALLCDVHLVGGGANFPAHRVVLAAASPYFQAMFTGGFKENQMSEITLNDTSSEGLKCVLDAIYTGELSISVENVCDVVPLANQLQLNEIVEHCGIFLSQNVSTHNCLSFLSVAEKYDLQEVEDECSKFVLENFDTVSQSTEFTNLSKQKLCCYLSDDQLKVNHGEIEVFRTALKWFEANRSVEGTSDNSTDVVDLMQHVRFPLIPGNILLDEVLTNKLISENTQVMRMVREGLWFHSNDNIFLQPLQEGKQFQPRGEEMLALVRSTGRRTGQSYTVGKTELHMIRGTDSMPFHARYSHQVLPMKLLLGSVSLVTKGSYLFVFGIETDVEHLRPVAVRFDVRKNTSLYLKPLPYKASWHMASALLNNNVYIMGGRHISRNSQNLYNVGNMSVSASQYSIETNSWSQLEDLPKPLRCHSAASYGNYVFCAGGFSVDKNSTDKLYAYDVVGKIWLSKASMIHQRAEFSLEAVGAKLVACGDEHSSSVEIYDIADNQWTLIHNEVLKNHISPAMVVKDNEVYVIGGATLDNAGTVTNTDDVSIVDVDKATIRRVSNIPFGVCYHVCALLTVPNTAAATQNSRVNNS